MKARQAELKSFTMLCLDGTRMSDFAMKVEQAVLKSFTMLYHDDT